MTALQINQANNHPAPGDMISAEPIRSLSDIAEIKDLLKYKPRDLAIFTIGINAGFRASDICKLRIGDVRALKIGDEFTIRMKKTRGKADPATVTKLIQTKLRTYSTGKLLRFR